MTRYDITTADSGVAIEISGVGDRQHELLTAFGERAAGQCSCPTDEYQKVAGMTIVPSGDSISIRLQAKEGAQFDAREIGQCLDYTVGKGAE